jgi:ATP-dependent Lon protease
MASSEGGVLESTRLTPEQLRWTCPDDCLDFETTEGVAPVQGTIGQERALRALRIGLELYAPGYNIYVSGLVGTGRHSTVKDLLEELRPQCAVPKDRAYVASFQANDKPRLLTFEAGGAERFRGRMEEFTNLLKIKLPDAFEGKAMAERRDEIIKGFGEKEEAQLKEFQERLSAEGFGLVSIQQGPVPRPDIFPLLEGEPVPLGKLAEQVTEGKMAQEELDAIEKRIEEYRTELDDHMRRGRSLAREMTKDIENLHREVGLSIVEGELDDIRWEFRGNKAVAEYVAEVQRDVLDKLGVLAAPEGSEARPAADHVLGQYAVNVIADRSGQEGCPVIVASNPTYSSLFGTIDREMAGPGVWKTDHTFIKGGALLEADGGYLLLNALDVLMQPGVWQALMQALKSGKLEIRVPEVPFLGMSSGLKPEAVDLSVKVILIGEPYYYNLLFAQDPDFRKIFKVKADFTPDMELIPENLDHFMKVVAKICAKEHLLPVSRDALARLAEAAVRFAGRQDRISTRFAEAADVVREADYWCRKQGEKLISRDHMRRAIEEIKFRNSLIDARMQEMIEKDFIIIRTDGEEVGQVNGLSVLDLGYHSFGKPTLITATTAVGQAGIINIEREARLSGGIYDKGVLIIAGWLRKMFAQRRPLALTASLCFEQSYAGVDGDSASIAEIFALLSDLSDIPIDQGFAVTGSINQRGQIQPIGGANEKIEGFFHLCKARGLTGKQGVILPKRNISDLMLSPDVVEAVADGKFHVHAVSSVSEGIEILTGVPAGERGKDGRFPEGTVFRAVDERLEDFLDALTGQVEEDWKPVIALPGAPMAAEPPPEPCLPGEPPRPRGGESDG